MNKKLYFELLMAIAVSILAAFFTLRAASFASEKLAYTEYVKQHYSEQREAADIKSLRSTASVTDLSSGSAAKLDSWCSSHPYTYFLISHAGKIIYSSDSGFTSGAARDMSYYSVYDSTDSFKKYDIAFSNDDYTVFVMSFFSSQLYSYLFVVCAALSVIVFIIVFTALVYRKVRYIDRLSHDIEILEGGNLEYEVTVRGKDELAQLAESLNAMRITLMRQNEAEAQQKKNSSELVTALSHDLRTPLTTQLGYLEIIKEKLGSADTSELKSYLEKSIATCGQIKDMSDRLFEYFLAYSKSTFDEPVDLERFDGTETLMQLITEKTVILEENGFSFHILFPDEQFFIKLNIGYMCRVINNIFSNISRYADRSIPVNIIASTEGHICTLSVSNHILRDIDHSESTHIGLISIEGLMHAQNGSADFRTVNGVFEVLLKISM